MRYLNEFMIFNFGKFISDKKFRFISVSPWYEKNENGEKIELGSKVTIFIDKDKTEYKNPKKEGTHFLTNSKEMMTVKIHEPLSYFEDWREDDEVIFTNWEKVIPYSSKNTWYFDSLSIVGNLKNIERVI